jgi:SAM-dependent methyltransferase
VNSHLLDRQRRSFDSLVESGVYDVAFDHSTVGKAFVGEVLRRVIPRFSRQGVLRILDCGCGTGAWLTYLREQVTGSGLTQLRLCGFDLSERMVELARTKLHGLAELSDIRRGNVLDRQSYTFDGVEGGFDLIFSYDVVQQLPRARQIESCYTMADALAAGGVALIFDNDSESPFGRRMALRKFLTRYCGLRLVPDYYCNAAYPQLERSRRRMESEGRFRTEIIVRDDGIKRVMVVAREAPLPGKAGAPAL